MAASVGSETSSSHIGRFLEPITEPITSEGTSTTSEITHELEQLKIKDQQRQFHGTQKYERLKVLEEQED